MHFKHIYKYGQDERLYYNTDGIGDKKFNVLFGVIPMGIAKRPFLIDKKAPCNRNGEWTEIR